MERYLRNWRKILGKKKKKGRKMGRKARWDFSNKNTTYLIHNILEKKKEKKKRVQPQL
jgi:hypothetical protein